ncbi:MAG: hypothetical protein ACXVCF_11430, partial [Isosphaeraceae bacterium]
QTDQRALNCRLSPRAVSSWEREFRIKIPRGGLPIEPVLLGNAGFVQDDADNSILHAVAVPVK